MTKVLIQQGTNNAIVTLDKKTLYFSYNTLVAVNTGKQGFKLDKCSPTTSTHLNKMGCKEFKTSSAESLESIALQPSKE